MRSAEARDAGIATGTTLRQATSAVRGAHAAISDTVGDLVGASLTAAAPAAAGIAQSVRTVQEVVTTSTYAAVGFTLDAGSRAAGLAAAWRLRERDGERPSIHDSRAAQHVIAVGSGLRGDHLTTAAPAVVPDLQVRAAGHRVDLTRDGLAAAYPGATSGIVVLLHGLCQSESIWAHLPDLGLTPVLVRYNTGLRISDTGEQLADMLTELEAGWPVPVQRIVLVGFSMGGLVVHSALAVADPSSPWRTRVTDTVTIGSPHHGSPWARGAHWMTQHLTSRPRGAWIADVLRDRSVGIKDLSHGNIVAADWLDHDPDDPADHRTHPATDDGIRHHALVGVLTDRLPPVMAAGIGDLVVPVDSALRRGMPAAGTRFAPERTAIVAGAHHLALPRHPEVHEQLRRWLEPTG